MKQDLTGKVAVITGGGGGIGHAVAVALAQEGMDTVLLGGCNTEKLHRTMSDVEAMGRRCLILPGNLSELSWIPEALKSAGEAFGRLDILINNAGVAQSTPFENVTEDEFDRIMAINIRVPFFVSQYTLPYLRKSDCASIINICSVVSHAGYPLQSAYTASKHALLGFTKSLAAELYKEGIRVHAIAPGGVYTDMVRISRPDLTPEGMIMPEDIADIVLFFLKNRGNAVVDEIMVHRVNKQPFLV